MRSDDIRRAELLERIQALLRTLPDEIVEELVRQWERELKTGYNPNLNSASSDEVSGSSDDES
ncbi:hypothetical protein FBR02_06670 [Anaerolineae bacterium CFX9]|nr:hypothetical protein [Anaerolineae bacterium CFX9]